MIRDILTFSANMAILCIKMLLVNMLTFSGYLLIYGILANPVNNCPRCSAKLLRICSLPIEFGTGGLSITRKPRGYYSMVLCRKKDPSALSREKGKGKVVLVLN
jgi:hypothetical protein